MAGWWQWVCSAFLAQFQNQSPLADIAEPYGVLDLNDVAAFSASFQAGCD